MRLGKILSGILGGTGTQSRNTPDPLGNGQHDPEEMMQICRDAGGDWERQAAACLIATTLVDDDATRSEAHYFRGNALEELERYDEAISEYDQAIALDPTFVDAIVNRGLTYRRKGDLDRARKDYDAAIGIAPDYREARMNRAFVFIQQDAYAEAMSDLDHLLAIDPTDIFALSNRSIAHRGLGNMDAAIRDLDRAVEIDPNNPRVRSHRSSYNEQLGNHELALEDLNRAVDLNKEDPEVHSELAELLAFGDVSVRDLRTAAEHQHFVVGCLPDDPEQRHKLAMILTLAGDVERAVSEWETLITMVGIEEKFQSELSSKGYLSESGITGKWDAASRAALTAYVKDERLPFDNQA